MKNLSRLQENVELPAPSTPNPTPQTLKLKDVLRV